MSDHREDHADRHALGGPDDITPYLDARYLGGGGSEATTVSDTASINLTLVGVDISGVVIPGGVDHNSLANLAVGDPHTQYQKESEKGAANGYAPLDASGLLLDSDIPSSIARDSEIPASTTALPEGTNLYFTDERAQDAVGVALTDSASVDFTYNDVANTVTAAVLPAGVDHGGLGGLADDDHPQYAMLGGRAGGQILAGGINAGEFLSLTSTSNASRGYVQTPDPFVLFPGTWQSATSTAFAFAVNGPSIRFLSNGSYTLASTPTIPNGLVDGQLLLIWNDATTGSVTLQDEAVLTGSNLRLASATTRRIGPRSSILLMWSSGFADWLEVSHADTTTFTNDHDHNQLTNLTTGDPHTQYTRKDTLTTKGDLYVRDGTGLTRIGVGTDGQVLTADSAQALGVKWAAAGGGVSDHGLLTGLADDDHTQYALLAGRAGGQTLIGGTASGDDLILKSTSHATLGNIGFNDEEVANIGKLRVGRGPSASTTEILAGSSATVSDGSSKVVATFGGARTFDTTAGGSYTLLNSAVLVTATANMTNVIGLSFSPTKGGSGTLTNLIGAKVAPTAGAGTTTNFTALEAIVTEQLGTTTTGIGVDIDAQATFGGTLTTGIGLRIGKNLGAGAGSFAGVTTAWAMQVGDFQSYHHGKLALGAASAPTYGLDLLGTAQDRGAIGLAESTATPTNPASSSGVVIYHKADKIVFAYNDAGTMRYKYLDLTGTGVTWVHTTTAP